MFKIGTFSKLSQITLKMLRHYDEIDLLKPAYIDQSNDYRYYSSAELITASKIHHYKAMGFSLREIKILLEHEEDHEMVRSLFTTRMNEIEQETKNLENQRQKINQIMKEEINMNMIQYNVIKKEIPARTVLSLRKKIATFAEESSLWDELYAFITKNEITPIYDGYTMTIYHDEEFKESDIDVELQVTVEKKGKDKGNIRYLDTDPVSVLSVTFAGSYEQMPKVTEAIANYAEQNGQLITGKMINIFHVSPAQTNVESEYITEAAYILKNS